MNMLGQEVRTPLVVESTAINYPLAGGGDTVVIVDVPSIHAKAIDVFVNSTVAVTSVSLRQWAASGKISYTVQIHGAIGAGVTAAIRWGDSLRQAGGTPEEGEPVGQYYDVLVNTAAAGTVNVWTAARS